MSLYSKLIKLLHLWNSSTPNRKDLMFYRAVSLFLNRMTVIMIGLLLFVSSTLFGITYSQTAKNDGLDLIQPFLRKAGATNVQKISKLLLVTRIHSANSNSFPSNEALTKFITANKPYVTQILVVLGAKSLQELEDVLAEYSKVVADLQMSDVVKFLPVYPWGYFTNALNQAILFAQDSGFDLIAFQSLEFKAKATLLDQMVKVLSKQKALVVGACMEGHNFKAGWNDITGRTTPWNTFAVWDVKKLSVFGFPLLGDGIINHKMGGVEEVTAITMAQNHLRSSTAILMDMSAANISWNTQFDDPQRAAWHEQKMNSKDERPAVQLTFLDRYKQGRVYHMPYDEVMRLQQK